MPCVPNNVAGLLVCRPRTLLIDTLVVLGLRDVLLDIVQENRPDIGVDVASLDLGTVSMSLCLKAMCMLLNRKATGADGSPKLLLVGRCTNRLPLVIINELPADPRLCMEVPFRVLIEITVRCPDTDPPALTTLRCVNLLLVRGCNGPWLTLMSLLSFSPPSLALLIPMAYRRVACRLLSIAAGSFPIYIIIRYRATFRYAP